MKKLFIIILLALSFTYVQPTQASPYVRPCYLLIQNVLVNPFQVTSIEKSTYLNKPAILVRYTTSYRHFVYTTTAARDKDYELLKRELN